MYLLGTVDDRDAWVPDARVVEQPAHSQCDYIVGGDERLPCRCTVRTYPKTPPLPLLSISCTRASMDLVSVTSTLPQITHTRTGAHTYTSGEQQGRECCTTWW
jgi:hypothetical protein